MSDGNDRVTVPTFFFAIMLGLAIYGFIALMWGPRPNSWHEEAVQAGKAEYYLDEKNVRQWRWKP